MYLLLGNVSNILNDLNNGFTAALLLEAIFNWDNEVGNGISVRVCWIVKKVRYKGPYLPLCWVLSATALKKLLTGRNGLGVSSVAGVAAALAAASSSALYYWETTTQWITSTVWVDLWYWLVGTEQRFGSSLLEWPETVSVVHNCTYCFVVLSIDARGQCLQEVRNNLSVQVGRGNSNKWIGAVGTFHVAKTVGPLIERALER